MSTVESILPGGSDNSVQKAVGRFLNAVIRNEGCDLRLARSTRRRIFALVSKGIWNCEQNSQWSDLTFRLAETIKDRSKRKEDVLFQAFVLFIESIAEEAAEGNRSIYGAGAGLKTARGDDSVSLEDLESRERDAALAAMVAEAETIAEAGLEAKLAEAIDRMTPRQREALRLKRDGHSPVEIAAQLKCSRATAYLELSKARETIRRCLRRSR